MGLSHSKEIDKDFQLFCEEDRAVILKLFGASTIENVFTIPRAKIHEQILTQCSQTHNVFVNRFCDLLPESALKHDHVSLKDYVTCAVHLLKGPEEGKAPVVIFLASGRKTHVTSSEILWYLETIISLFELFSMLSPAYKTWKPYLVEDKNMTEKLSLHLARDLFFKGVPAKDIIHHEVPQSQYSEIEVGEWLLKNHFLREIHQMLYTRIFNLQIASQVAPIIPLCSMPAYSNGYKKYLSFPELILINLALPVEVRDQWRQLYSSSAHGESFSSMLGRILAKGPSIVFVEDKNGHRFGGFAAEEWKICPQYYGKSSSFLFSLKPGMEIHGPTGFNDHYQYLNLKCQTFPNGLGLGGQLEYFGIWIDSNFGKGYCSPSCTTYDIPQFSYEKEFLIDHLEVWGVGPEPKVETSERVSILDVDMEATAMLKIVGRNPVSEGIRDTPTADIPGEKELPPLDSYGSSP